MKRGLAVGSLVVLLVTGCTFPRVPAPTASAPAASPTSTAPAAPVSPAGGTAVDRPTLADPGVTPDGYAAPPGGTTTLEGYLDQSVGWAACGDGLECADVLAPLDYASPGEQALTLSLKKRPASDTPKLGTLFVNPGGPGASGKDLVDYFDADGLGQYDIVGWDPRGTGDSTPVKCFSDAEADVYNDLDTSPDTAEERTDLIDGVRDLADSCWQSSGTLLEHISTIETVRDLDLLRRLVGDDRLTFLGYSYGTQIGATYAELFPQQVGRLVLDAAVNVTDNDDVIQAMGFDTALGNFAQWCADRDCQLGSSKQEVLDTITGLWDELDANPLATGSGRELTQSLAVSGVAALLYGGKDAWRSLELYVHAARFGDGSALLWAADQLSGRDDKGRYDTLFYAFPAISCLDSTDDGVTAADATWKDDEQKAPIFGRYFGPQYTCALWPVRPALQLDITGADAAPIVVIGGTGDNATPYQQAVDMADQLASGVLVTYEGEGHGSYGGKSTCIDDLVVAYLVRGLVPADGTRCS